MVRFLLLRHAEVAIPVIFHGFESDVGLSERGLRQAEALAEVIAEEKPDRLICSGMLRARLTAGAIQEKTGLELEIEPDLHERKVGNLCGQPTNNCDGVEPTTLDSWLLGETEVGPDGSESFNQVRNRVVPVWERLAQTSEGQTLAVVAHGVVVRTLMLSLLPGYSIGDWPRIGGVKNASITELIFESGAWRAERLAEQPESVAAVE